MTKKIYKLSAIPNSWQNYYICVRQWSAKGKAINRLKTVLSQLEGYNYLNNDDLHNLFEWVRQQVEIAQTENKSKYAIAVESKEAVVYDRVHCRAINVYSTKMDGDIYADITTIYALPIAGNLSIGYAEENCVTKEKEVSHE